MEDHSLIGLQLTPENTSSSSTVVDLTKCIICQKESSAKTSSTVNGHKRVREASQLRQDDVYKRLKDLNETEEFVYQVANRCQVMAVILVTSSREGVSRRIFKAAWVYKLCVKFGTGSRK